MNELALQLRSKILKSPRDWVFCATDFGDLGTKRDVSRALVGMARAGEVRALDKGLYDRPSWNAEVTAFGGPNPDELASALARRDGFRVLVHGARAAHLLGLSAYKPSQFIYLVDKGPSRIVEIEGVRLALRRAPDWRLALAGRPSGVIVQALTWLGEGKVRSAQHRLSLYLRRVLPDQAKRDLLKGVDAAPSWLRPILDEAAEP